MHRTPKNGIFIFCVSLVKPKLLCMIRKLHFRWNPHITHNVRNILLTSKYILSKKSRILIWTWRNNEGGEFHLSATNFLTFDSIFIILCCTSTSFYLARWWLYFHSLRMLPLLFWTVHDNIVPLCGRREQLQRHCHLYFGRFLTGLYHCAGMRAQFQRYCHFHFGRFLTVVSHCAAGTRSASALVPGEPSGPSLVTSVPGPRSQELLRELDQIQVRWQLASGRAGPKR